MEHLYLQGKTFCSSSFHPQNVNFLLHLFLSHCSPIGAPGGLKGKSRPSGLSKTPSTAGKGRSRNTRSTGSVDPQGLVGRRIWRYYPDEDPQNHWVEGFLTDYDTKSNTYTILYDPNTAKETTEDLFDPNANNPVCFNGYRFLL